MYVIIICMYVCMCCRQRYVYFYVCKCIHSIGISTRNVSIPSRGALVVYSVGCLNSGRLLCGWRVFDPGSGH